MVTTTIIVGKFILIMATAILFSIISIFFGLYYLVKAIYFAKASSDTAKLRHYLLTAVVYLIFLPICILIISSNIIVPLAATVQSQIEVEHSISVSGAVMIHQTNPFYLYLYILALGGIAYWIKNYKEIYKKKV